MIKVNISVKDLFEKMGLGVNYELKLKPLLSTVQFTVGHFDIEAKHNDVVVAVGLPVSSIKLVTGKAGIEEKSKAFHKLVEWMNTVVATFNSPNIVLTKADAQWSATLHTYTEEAVKAMSPPPEMAKPTTFKELLKSELPTNMKDVPTPLTHATQVGQRVMVGTAGKQGRVVAVDKEHHTVLALSIADKSPTVYLWATGSFSADGIKRLKAFGFTQNPLTHIWVLGISHTGISPQRVLGAVVFDLFPVFPKHANSWQEAMNEVDAVDA